MEVDQGVMARHLALQIQQYRIPEFQRPYSWQKSDWETLLIDVLRQYKAVKKGWTQGESSPSDIDYLAGVSNHYIGTLVTANPVTVTPPHSTVVDGQQRLLTSIIMILAAKDLWLKRLGRTAANKLEVETVTARFNPYIHNTGAVGLDKWRILPNETDRRAYGVLVDEDRQQGNIPIDSLGLSEFDSPQLIAAFNYFRREFCRTRLPQNAPFRFSPFAALFPLDPAILEYTVLNRIYAIKLVALSSDDPNMIFESLNTKGRALQQVDLIKNFLYLSLGSEASMVHQAHWRPMELTLTPRELERFAWAWQVSHGENVLQKRTYESVQRRLRGKQSSEVKEYVQALQREAGWYQKITSPIRETDDLVRDALQRVTNAGGATALPLMLYCYRQMQEEHCTVSEFIASMDLIESFLVRRMLAGRGTQTLNSMFGSMCDKLNPEEPEPDEKALPIRIQEVLLARPDEWPDSNAVRTGIAHEDFYHKSDKIQKYHILKRLDSYYNTKKVHIDYELSENNVEHIAPQNSEAEWWKDALSAEEWTGMLSRIHALCNLTLLNPIKNSSLQDAGWPTKHAAYDGDDYPLTARIAEFFDVQGGWTLVRMDDRTDDLVVAVDQIWPRPEPSAPLATDSGVATPTGEDEDDAPYEGGTVDLDADE